VWGTGRTRFFKDEFKTLIQIWCPYIQSELRSHASFWRINLRSILMYIATVNFASAVDLLRLPLFFMHLYPSLWSNAHSKMQNRRAATHTHESRNERRGLCFVEFIIMASYIIVDLCSKHSVRFKLEVTRQWGEYAAFQVDFNTSSLSYHVSWRRWVKWMTLNSCFYKTFVTRKVSKGDGTLQSMLSQSFKTLFEMILLSGHDLWTMRQRIWTATVALVLLCCSRSMGDCRCCISC